MVKSLRQMDESRMKNGEQDNGMIYGFSLLAKVNIKIQDIAIRRVQMMKMMVKVSHI